MSPSRTALSARHLWLALVVVAIWGSNFVVIKLALAHLPPLLLATLRFALAAVPLVLLGLVVAHILALHEVGSNNPDGVEIKAPNAPKDANGNPLDGIPFHPYYTVHDILGVCVFLMPFSAVVFFAPEFGGYFLEYNNFIPADPLKTPAHIAPVWYFTPYYSMLRATTTDLLYVLAAGVVVLVAFYWREIPRGLWRKLTLAVAAVLLVGFYFIEAKVWGVVLMGASVLFFFLMPWLDRAPVKSIRYKGPLYKTALAIFVVAFLVLGWLGTEAPTPAYTRLAQVGTLLYFGFFILMPWYSKADSHKPVPSRVTK